MAYKEGEILPIYVLKSLVVTHIFFSVIIIVTTIIVAVICIRLRFSTDINHKHVYSLTLNQL